MVKLINHAKDSFILSRHFRWSWRMYWNEVWCDVFKLLFKLSILLVCW